MPHKQVLFHSAAREKVLRGATLLADAVRVTLGPKSKSVLIQRSWGAPIVCNDGVTIAKEFDLKDPEENLGAQVLRQAAEKTGDVVGDGTSTSTILAHTIFADGARNVAAGAGAIDLKRGLDRGLPEYLRSEIFLGVLEVEFLGDRHAVVADDRGSPLLFDQDRLRARPQGDAHRIG